MARDPRFDVLFEPVRIGPVVAKNRFYQVPHCNGMGWRDPSMLAAMRGVKAEGGWAVVATEEVEIHPSSEITPYVEGRLWDDRDLSAHRLVTDAVHAHDALAAIEFVHHGLSSPNLSSRVPPMGPSPLPVVGWDAPVQAREMTLADIEVLRRWHREATERAIAAGYDIVYVYAGHGLSTFQHFLSPRYNLRTDRYGGSLENRLRLLREVLEDTLEVAAGRAAVACRLAVHEMLEGGYTVDDVRAVLRIVGELPDLWDFVVGRWEHDSVTSRFGAEGFQEDLVRGLKELTSKPVVGVGRFTSPETMLRMVREGVLDFIGAARPSIADPFLPRKIEEGRLDELRECIGCNICVTGDWTTSPIRCTQNPSMGEEWRRGWHPERSAPAKRPGKVLVVGGGPAGLEAALTAGRKGHEVVLVEATRTLGGRVGREAALPGLAAWRRVVDYRLGRIDAMANVSWYLESTMTADEVLGYDFDHVAVATGATWRRDGVGRIHTHPIPDDGTVPVFTPDDLMADRLPVAERVVVYDDDRFYLAGVLAELLAREGRRVTYLTPAAVVSAWTEHTLEQGRIQARLLDLGVEILTHRAVDALAEGTLLSRCVFTGRTEPLPADAVVMVTARLPEDGLAVELLERRAEWPANLRTLRAVGDAFAPGTIAAAVWDGRRFAEELDGPDEAALFRRDVPVPGARG
ncbi:MAG TPA: FAD-dependent oxidoreductase [Actinobacteria bacterium]|nr:FAD-dependent oxidoreductase [Actinomycetota bacterium]